MYVYTRRARNPSSSCVPLFSFFFFLYNIFSRIYEYYYIRVYMTSFLLRVRLSRIFVFGILFILYIYFFIFYTTRIIMYTILRTRIRRRGWRSYII